MNLNYTELQAIRYLDGARDPEVNVIFVLSTELGRDGWGERLDTKNLTRKGWSNGWHGRVLSPEGLKLAQALKSNRDIP